MKQGKTNFVCYFSLSRSDVNFPIHETVHIFKMLVGAKEIYTCSLPRVNGA